MTEPTTRRRLARALSVAWSPALAARVRRRVDEAIVRRRQRRRAALLTLALLLAGGLSYAFSRPWRAAPVAPTATRPARPSATPAPSPSPSTAAPAAPAAPLTAPAAAPLRTPTATPAPERGASGSAPRPATAARVETVDSLFAAADAARLAGRFRDAVAPLTAIFTRFPSDPRAAVAAFQLGRVLQDDLGDRIAAAAAFSRALALDPRGPLAADAALRARAALDGARGSAP